MTKPDVLREVSNNLTDVAGQIQDGTARFATVHGTYFMFSSVAEMNAAVERFVLMLYDLRGVGKVRAERRNDHHIVISVDGMDWMFIAPENRGRDGKKAGKSSKAA